MEQLKNALINLCNQSQLPAEAVYFVVKDLFRDAEDLLRQTKEQERLQKIMEENQEESLPEIDEEIEDEEE